MTPTREEFWAFASWEKTLFYAVTFLSMGIMAYQIFRRIQLWRQGRPLPWREAREGLRYWIPTPSACAGWLKNVGVYVLGQKKVRSSRKKSGAPMHLMLFYGFLTLTIGTTLLAVNTYSPWKFHHGSYYLAYEMVMDVMGAVYMVGVTWAIFRRVKMKDQPLGQAEGPDPEKEPEYHRLWVENRRRPLSHSRNDFLTLGLLFLLGFSGFLLEAMRMSAHPDFPQPFNSSAPIGNAISLAMGPVSVGMYKYFWWQHGVLVWIFFATLPMMRIRHIAMAILSISGSPRQPMGKLRSIPMEEVEETGQIGVSAPKDYTRWHLMSLDACMECGRCTEVCPAWSVGKVLNPKQVVQDIRGAMQTGTAVAEAVGDEALWACTTCNACVEACPVLIRHVDLIVDARRHIVAEGRLSGTGATMLRQTASTSNAWGAPASAREDWMKGLDVPLCRDGAPFDYLFWVGCAGATDPGAVKTTKAVAGLLKQAGVSFACLGQEEACTGDPARRVGDEFLFQEKAMQNASVFERYGVKKVVTACPHCFNTLKHEYGEYGAQMEVFHHTQLLQHLVAEGKLKAADGKETVLHDPCYLGRVNDESEAPRALLSGDQIEPKHHGKKTLCCGAGGGRMWMEEPPSQRPNNRRAEELIATGAKNVAVGCPFCRIMIHDGLQQAGANEIRLLDLAEMLQEANSAPASQAD